MQVNAIRFQGDTSVRSSHDGLNSKKVFTKFKKVRKKL